MDELPQPSVISLHFCRICLFIFVAACLCQAARAQSETWEHFREHVTAKPMVFDTPLVDKELSHSVIVIPQGDAYLDLAEVLQDRLARLVAVEVPIQRDSDWVTGVLNQWRQVPSTHLILLGDLTSNRAVARLYMDFMAFEDAAFPGANGYTVRSVIDPYGADWNAVILGGTDEKAVGRAVDGFVSSLQIHDDGQTLVAPYQLTVQMGDQSHATQRIQAYAASAKTRLRQWPMTSGNPAGQWVRIMDEPFSTAALNYALSGDPELIETAIEALMWVDRHFEQIASKATAQTYYDLHYHLEIWLRAWQQIANTPYLSREQRDRGMALMAFLADKAAVYAEYVNLQAYGSTGYRILSRHGYSGIFAGDALCRYVLTHAVLGPEARQSLERNRALFARVLKEMTQTYTTGFDHKWVFDGHWHLLQWAMEQSNQAYIDSGMARLNVDFATMCINNHGGWVVYGADSTTPNEGYDAWQILGRGESLFRDGTYQWWLDRHLAGVPYKPFIYVRNWAGHWFATREQAVRPEHLIGINRAPIAKPIYDDLRAGRGRIGIESAKVNAVPWDDTFSKVTLRDGLAPSDQYLLVDGIGGTTYNGKDANAILEYSRFGKVLLIDAELSREPFYRNTAAILTADQGHGVAGTFARLRHQAAFEGLFYLCSDLDPLHTGQHRRHLFMKPGGYVLAFDEVKAGRGSKPVLGCTFRSLGTPTLDARTRTWRVQQDDVALVLQNVVAPSQTAWPTLIMDRRQGWAGTPASWQGYGNTVEILRQMVRGTPGRWYTFANLFYGEKTQHPTDYLATALSDRVVRVEKDTVDLYAIGSGEQIQVGDLEIVADGCHINAQQIHCFGLRRLAIGTRQVIESATPIQLVIELESGRCTVASVENEATPRPIVWCPKWTQTFEWDRAEVVADWGIRVWPMLSALRDAVHAALTEPAPRALNADRAEHDHPRLTPQPLWQADAAITATARCLFEADGQGLTLLATENGTVALVNDPGSELWTFQAGAEPVRCLWGGLVDGQATVIVGDDKGRVRALNRDGSVRWAYQNTHNQYTRGAYYIFTAVVGPFARDGHDAIALGGYGGVVFLRADGTFERFIPLYGHAVTQLKVIDVASDTEPWLLAAPVSNAAFLIDPARGVAHPGWQRLSQGFCQTTHLAQLKVTPQGGRVVHAGSFGIGIGEYTVKRVSGEATLVFDRWQTQAWYRTLSGEPKTVWRHPERGDQVVIGTDAGFILVLDRTGRIVRSLNVGAPVDHLIVVEDVLHAICKTGEIFTLSKGLSRVSGTQYADLPPEGVVAIWSRGRDLLCVTKKGFMRLTLRVDHEKISSEGE